MDKDARKEMDRFREVETGSMLEGESWRSSMNQIPIAGNIKRTIDLLLGVNGALRAGRCACLSRRAFPL